MFFLTSVVTFDSLRLNFYILFDCSYIIRKLFSKNLFLMFDMTNFTIRLDSVKLAREHRIRTEPKSFSSL